MHFVHGWNTAVEDSLNGNFNSVKMRIKFDKMEEKINYLIGLVKEQEDEIGLLKKRNCDIEHGQLWLKRNVDETPSSAEGNCNCLFLPLFLFLFYDYVNYLCEEFSTALSIFDFIISIRQFLFF